MQLAQVVFVVRHAQRHGLVVPPRRGQFRPAVAKVRHADRHGILVATRAVIVGGIRGVVAIGAGVAWSAVVVVAGRREDGVNGGGVGGQGARAGRGAAPRSSGAA